MVRGRLSAAVLAGALMLGVAAPASGQKMTVFPLPDTLWPDASAPIGQPLTLKPGDELMRATVMQTRKLTLSEPVKVSIDRFSDDLAIGEELTTVIGSDSTEAALGRGPYYCGRDQRSRSELAALLIGGFGSKFRPIVRFCFIDSNRDGTLDQVFLAGAKDKALQKAVPIDPVRYRGEVLVPRDASQYLRLRYRKYVPKSNKVQIELEVFESGKKRVFDYVIYEGPGGAALQEQPYRQTNPKKVPYPAVFTNILGASVAVNGVDPDGTARFEIRRNFRPSLFRPVSIQAQMIFIYM